MLDAKLRLLFLAGPAPGGEPSPILSLLPILLIFGIFYFVLILPMRTKQKKVEALQKTLKAGDRVVLSPGIFGTVVGVEPDALTVRIAEQTKIKVLRSAVAALQGPSNEAEKK